MLAARYRTSGPRQGVLEVQQVPDVAPGRGEVRVRVAVSGVNPTDWKARRPGGLASGDAEFVVPNQDGAGTIDAVGEGVDSNRIGQRVWLYNAAWRRSQGTAAQWIALPAAQAVPLPERTSFDLGASLGIPAITAHRCLFSRGHLPPGARVLVHGGAGAVGHAAIELAVWAGARVAATVSSEQKAALAADAGAELVVNYRTSDSGEAIREWAPKGVHRIADVDLAHNAELDASVLAVGGTISSYAVPERPVTLDRLLMVRNATIDFILIYAIPEDAKQAAIADISSALADGALTPLPLSRFPLSEIAAAHDAVEHGTIGKVIVDVP
jgi:NADPH:quinone reductase